jgi:Zn-finger nucleic acid-binding protein
MGNLSIVVSAGLFFDDGELEGILKMFGYTENIQISEHDIFSENLLKDDLERNLLCPVDQSQMKPEAYNNTLIDRCPSCDGIWLDKGELVVLKLAEKSIKDNLTLYIRLGQ